MFYDKGWHCETRKGGGDMNRPTNALQWLDIISKTGGAFSPQSDADLACQLLAYIKELEEKAWMYDDLSR